jgi:hypothetical protein
MVLGFGGLKTRKKVSEKRLEGFSHFAAYPPDGDDGCGNSEDYDDPDYYPKD